VKPVVLFFSDVAGFTSFSETLTPYDVMYLLNRYFTQVGELIERNDGYIDKFVGDGVMAIFGVEGQPDAPIRSVNAALQTLVAVDRMKPFFASMYGIDFNIRIGLHLGEAVVGSIGSPGHERLTAIGDAVNVASRVEAANKEADTRLLISEALYDRVKDEVEMSDFIRVRLRGTSDRITLYEIAKLRPDSERALNAVATRPYSSPARSGTRPLVSIPLSRASRRCSNFLASMPFRSSPRPIGGASGQKSLAANFRFQSCCLRRVRHAYVWAPGVRARATDPARPSAGRRVA
jgi:class 3 adenylate cyclase